jgi:hypothetical protein
MVGQLVRGLQTAFWGSIRCGAMWLADDMACWRLCAASWLMLRLVNDVKHAEKHF